MPHEKWFWSDPHFFHTNLLKFMRNDTERLRHFNSLDEMHETLVKNHNDLVGHGDYVYWLGDITFQYHRPFNELMHRFKGDKRLIVGNHDKLKQEGLLSHFSKVMLWHGFKTEGFTAVHIPLMLSSLRDGKFCVHGHTHHRLLEDPHYINVCVENTKYRPVHMDEILEHIKQVES